MYKNSYFTIQKLKIEICNAKKAFTDKVTNLFVNRNSKQYFKNITNLCNLKKKESIIEKVCEELKLSGETETINVINEHFTKINNVNFNIFITIGH